MTVCWTCSHVASAQDFEGTRFGNYDIANFTDNPRGNVEGTFGLRRAQFLLRAHLFAVKPDYLSKG